MGRRVSRYRAVRFVSSDRVGAICSIERSRQAHALGIQSVVCVGPGDARGFD
jgi:hypothetical protein